MIPLSRPHTAVNEEPYIRDALHSGHAHGDGPYSGKAAERLRAISGADGVLLVPSASHALELIFWNMPEGAEVVMPAYTFPSAANAVCRNRGRVVLCDVEPGTLNLDPAAAASCVTAETWGVCATHNAGVACDMDAFTELARKRGILLIEDAAQAIGATHSGRALGGLGDFGCYSFHGTKNISCGEGGVFLQRASDESTLDLARRRREKGTNRHQFERGEATCYSWETCGSSMLLAEINCAQLMAQLEELDAVTARRNSLCATYAERLDDLFISGRLTGMHVPAYAGPNGHGFHIRLRSLDERRDVQDRMASRGIACLPHYVPLHLGSMGKELGYAYGDFPESERAWETLLRLPVFPAMADEQVDIVCGALREVLS